MNLSVPSASAPNPSSRVWVRALVGLSEAVLRLERHAVLALMALLLGLILLNVATRYGGWPLFWIDEAAVFAIVWLSFVGASAMSRLRLDFAVTLLTDHLGPTAKRRVKVAATGFTLLFAAGLLWMCALWLDPVGMARAGFDAKAFAGVSFNFIYTERSQALGWPNWVMYLVMPLFALTSCVHAVANLLEDLGLQAPVPREAATFTTEA